MIENVAGRSSAEALDTQKLIFNFFFFFFMWPLWHLLRVKVYQRVNQSSTRENCYIIERVYSLVRMRCDKQIPHSDAKCILMMMNST